MKYLLLIVLVLFTGCTSKWESSMSVGTIESSGKILYAQAPQNSAYIYVYREDAFRGILAAAHLKLNNGNILKLKNASYLLIKTNPGKKTLYAQEHIIGATEVSVTFDAKAGQVYFFRRGRPSFLSDVATFFPKDASSARAELSKYELVNVYEDYDPSYVPSRDIRQQKCSTSSNLPKCVVVLADIRGKVIVNRGSNGFRARPGMRLSIGDKVITTNNSEAFLMVYGEPIMVRVNNTFKVTPPR